MRRGWATRTGTRVDGETADSRLAARLRSRAPADPSTLRFQVPHCWRPLPPPNPLLSLTQVRADSPCFHGLFAVDIYRENSGYQLTHHINLAKTGRVLFDPQLLTGFLMCFEGRSFLTPHPCHGPDGTPGGEGTPRWGGPGPGPRSEFPDPVRMLSPLLSYPYAHPS